LVALESQACGTPVVGIRGSAMDDLIFHEQDDWALENKAEALADAIERFAAKDLPTLGKEAAERAARLHAWPRVFRTPFLHLPRVCANYKGNPADEPTRSHIRSAVIEKTDRDAVRRLCCQTGFLGTPIDPVYEDRHCSPIF